ncbi:MAG: TPM domain-containing protein [Bacteroidales bacterium]|nr:TPM domain-containing protein [Bacteroidales bacterium]
MQAVDFFTQEQKLAITNAIRQAEANTSGEIRFHAENKCAENELDRAAYWFKALEMHKTEQRNGVLFYLAIKDKKFAILGDAGINKTVPANFWDSIKETCLAAFKEGKHAEGLAKGIEMAGEQLKKHFPYKLGDVNELSDELSFGKQ